MAVYEGERLYADAAGTIVSASDPTRRMLIAVPGRPIPPAWAARVQAYLDHDQPEAAPKRKAASANKRKQPAEDKGQ